MSGSAIGMAHEVAGDELLLRGKVEAAPSDSPASEAGLGSEVVVEDSEQGTRTTYTLVAGPLVDFDNGQVSLASPIGRALLGTRAGELVSVDTPQRRRRLRIVSVRTLQQQHGGRPSTKPAA